MQKVILAILKLFLQQCTANPIQHSSQPMQLVQMILKLSEISIICSVV